METLASFTAPLDPLTRLQNYCEFAEAFPEYFVGGEKENWICRDPEEIRGIEESVASLYAQKGLNPAWAQVGVYYEDPYCIMVRDALRFSNGRPAMHHRI